jgi:hypothetical protein
LLITTVGAADHAPTTYAVVQDSGGGSVWCVDGSGEARVVASLDHDPSGALLAGRSLWTTSVTSDRDHLVAVDAATGAVARRSDLTEPAQTVVAAGGRLWVRTLEGDLVPVDPSTGAVGEPIDTPSFPMHLAGTPSTLWAAARDGSLYRIDARTGTLDDVVLRVAGARAAGVVIGALATDRQGTLWIALSGESLLLGVDPKTNTVVHRIRYARPVPASTDVWPGTALAISGDYAWVGIDSAAGTVPEPTLVRVNLRTGRVRAFEAGNDAGVEQVAAAGSDVWIGGDAVAHFDARTNRFAGADISYTTLAALIPHRCTARQRAPKASDRVTEDRDNVSGPRRSAEELRRLDYSAYVASQLPPEFDTPPTTSDLAGQPFRLVLCNRGVSGPSGYVAGLRYSRPGPESVEEWISGWSGDQANEIFDRARAIVAGCKVTTIRSTTFRPIPPPLSPDGLGDEALVLSRDAGDGVVFTDLLIRQGQFLFLVHAHDQLPGLAPQAAAQLDRLTGGG